MFQNVEESPDQAHPQSTTATTTTTAGTESRTDMKAQEN